MAEKINETERDELKWISNAWQEAEKQWENSNKKEELKRAINLAFKYMKENKLEIDTGSMEKNIAYFNEQNAKLFDLRVIDVGYTYVQDAIEDFLKYPNIFWEQYDRARDKKKFLTASAQIYGTDRRKNLLLFTQDYFNYFMFDSNPQNSLEKIDSFSNELREKIIKLVEKDVREKGRKNRIQDAKRYAIESLKNAIEELKIFGALENELVRYNDLLTVLNLDSLVFSAGEKGIKELEEVFSESNLEPLDFFQLEAMIAFYTNRISKVEEELGLGMFLIASLSKEDGKLKEEELKVAWQEYYVLHKIFKEKHSLIMEKCDSVENLNGMENMKSYTNEDVYNNFLIKYEKIMSLLTSNARNFKNDCDIFCSTTGLAQVNNYRLKDYLLEDLIIQSSRQKINWGYIEENDNPGLNKFVLVGIDVPGLNMPLRLHMPLEKLRKVVKEYLGMDEIPVYIGKDDFEHNGEVRGTPLIIPFSNDARKKLKNKADEDKKQHSEPEKQNKMLQHLNLMQLANSAQRLLGWKIGKNKKKKYVDHMNLDTGIIRITEEQIIPQK